VGMEPAHVDPVTGVLLQYYIAVRPWQHCVYWAGKFRSPQRVRKEELHRSGRGQGREGKRESAAKHVGGARPFG